ncbi:MAG: hypothetical protein ABSH03_00895 [Candidatus Lustribacter sp.]|jgi:hypothetical protein
MSLTPLNSNNQPVILTQPLPFSAEQNQPQPSAPPGSIGHQTGPISGQLVKGNPGGVGASDVSSGIGAALDAST